MKIALIGNMNNCFFSIMRYFRDLNIDTHLFLYQNEQNLFKPENDTYYIEKYQDFIHKLSISNSGIGLILCSKEVIKEELKGFDFFIGCGIAPALFKKLNYQLDIFIPYQDNIEITVNEKLPIREFIKYPVRRYAVKQQIKGIQNNTTKIIASAIQKITKDSITRLDVLDKHIKKYILMIYKEESKISSKYQNLMKGKDLVVFSHARHYWKDHEEYEMEDGGVKGTDKLIIGYANFIKKNPNINSVLIFFEYGKDVEASKDLISQYGIEEYVKWLPSLPRKEIIHLIEYSDIVVDALAGSMWGGVGFEGLSCGKLIMQNILQSDKEYYKEMGHELPFIMKANQAEQVEKHFEDFIHNREYYSEKSKENKIWFDKYAGIGLAKDYKKIIEEIYKERR